MNNFECPRCGHCCQALEEKQEPLYWSVADGWVTAEQGLVREWEEHMSTSFKPEWLQPGAVIPVDIPTLAAFAEELRRVMQENEELRTALVRTMNLYNTAAIHRDRLFEKLIEPKLKEKNNG